MRRALRFTSWIFLTFVGASCPGPKTQGGDTAPPKAPAPTAASNQEGLHVIATRDPGLTFKLGEGVEGAEARRPTPPAPAAPLADAVVQKILARLAPLKTEAGDQKEFAMRDKSLPPPRTGKTVKESFPPPEAPPVPDKTEVGPLEVLRHAPEGEVPLAPHVSLSFSQPMVAVTSYAELEKLPIPAKLDPQPPGRWRWVGTKTLLFEPPRGGDGDRFPMATDYTVTVPAGTRSATAGTLAKAATWKFSTPPVTLEAFFPEDGPVKRDPVLFAAFDQKIQPQAVLATVHVTAAGKEYGVRLATRDEIAADAGVSRLAAALDADARQDRYLAFKPSELLPVDAAVSVAIGPGTPSAEGPRRTTKAIEKGFRTYGAMRINDQSCRKGDECPPTSALWVSFTNPIDEKKFSREMVKVEPAIPSMKVVARGNGLSLVGRTKGRTTYVATFGAQIPDTFGQTHEKEERITFRVGSAGKSLFAMGGNFVVLDPNAGARFSVYSVNHSAVHVKAFAQAPETWKDFAKFMREVWNREQVPPDPPGRRVIDETVPVKGEPDELTETSIDLGRALTGGSGSVVLLVEPTVRPKNRWEWQPVIVWVSRSRASSSRSRRRASRPRPTHRARRGCRSARRPGRC